MRRRDAATCRENSCRLAEYAIGPRADGHIADMLQINLGKAWTLKISENCEMVPYLSEEYAYKYTLYLEQFIKKNNNGVTFCLVCCSLYRESILCSFNCFLFN